MADPFGQAAQELAQNRGGGGGGGKADPFGAAAQELGLARKPSAWTAIKTGVSAYSPMLGAGMEMLEGGAKGLASTLAHTYDWAAKASGVKYRQLDNPEARAMITPDNGAQRLGFGLEQGAEYAIPIPGMNKVVAKGSGPVARTALRAATEAGKGGLISGMQTGGDPTQMAIGATLGGVGGAVTHGAGEFWNKNIVPLTSDLFPARRAAAEAFTKAGGEVDPATRTGSAFLKQAKKFLASGPKAAQAEEMARRQGQQYLDWGRDILNRAAGGQAPASPVVMAEREVGRLNNQWQMYADIADQNYNGFRGALKFLGQKIDVDRSQLKAGLQPIYDNLKNTLTPTQKSLSPTWQALEEIMELGTTKTVGQPGMQINRQTVRTVTPPPSSQPATQVNVQTGMNKTPVGGGPTAAGWSSSTSSYTAPGQRVTNFSSTTPGNLRTVKVGGENVVDIETALADLHNLYTMAKVEGGEIARNMTKGIGAKILSEYRQLVDDSIKAVNPTLLDTLNAGRVATTRKYEVLGLLRQLGVKGAEGGGLTYEPAQVFDKLTRDREGSLHLLQTMQRVDPSELRRVGAAYLTTLMDKGSKAGAAEPWVRAEGVLNDWINLGQDTKQILFGTNMTRQLDDFFRMGKYLSENPQPSGSGVMMAMATRFMGLVKNPIWAAKETGLELAVGRYLFSTRGPMSYNRFLLNAHNPIAQSVAALYRSTTGVDPSRFANEQ